MADFLRRAFSLPARAVSGLIWLYQQAVSPALAALNPTCGCRFAPTCSHYARERCAHTACWPAASTRSAGW